MKSRARHKTSGVTLLQIREKLHCEPILYYINRRAARFAFHIARRSERIPPWRLTFGGVSPFRRLRGVSTVGQRKILRWYIHLLRRKNVVNYDYRVWSRIAQDRNTADETMIENVAYSEYRSNPPRILSGTIRHLEDRVMEEVAAGDSTPSSRKIRCPCLCTFTCKNEHDLTRHITNEHPLTKMTWKCSCGYEPMTSRDAGVHRHDCASFGNVVTSKEVRRVWRMTSYGLLTETNEVAT